MQDVRRMQKEKNNTNIGFDGHRGRIVDMLEKGIIDPAKVARQRLENAASIAAMILTTEALITDMPEKGTPLPCRRCRSIKQESVVTSQTKPCKSNEPLHGFLLRAIFCVPFRRYSF